MKQSTFSAVMANNLLTVLHGYSKTIRLLLVMFLTLSVSAEVWAEDFEKYSGAITEGDYLIVYNNGAMKNTVSSDRLQYTTVTVSNNKISNPNASLIWHIAPSGNYWTIYNANVGKYAAGTGVKNKAQLLTSGTDNNSLWTVSGTSTYEFVNKANKTAGVNSNLRRNGTYGFACYGTGTGGALTLYKKVTAAPSHTITATSNNDSYGTVTLEGTTITATPNAGYRVSTTTPYTISPSGSATVTQNGNTFTVTPSANTTITINFEAIPKYTVTLVPGSGSVTNTELEEPNAGAGVTLPTPTLDCGDWEFAGWKTTSAVTTETTTEPTLIPAGAYSPTSDITLYAVYQRTETTEGAGTTEVTKTVSISDYASAKSWNNENRYTTVNIDANITATASSNPATNTGKYYSNDNSWRFYQNETGKLTITANEGITLKSITLTFTNKDSGTISYNSNSCTSNTAISVSGQSATFTVGSSSGSKGKILITKISVTYESTSGGGSTTYYHSTPDCGSTQQSYTLTLHSGLSCVTDGSATVELNATEVTNFIPATRDGFTCIGYWSAPSGGVQVLNADGKFAATSVQDYITDGKWTKKDNVTLTPHWECSNTMTLSVGTQSGGTYSLSKTSLETCDCTDAKHQVTITATPNSGYSVTDISYSGDGTATKVSGPTVNGENTEWVYQFNQGDNGNGTFTVTFTTIPTYTITWMANGQEFHKQQDATHGTDLAVPSAPDPETYACDDKVFVGWTATQISGTTNDEPDDLFTTKTAKVQNAANTYYAVFATVEGGGETAKLVKMTADDDFNIGDKIVIIADGNQYGLYQKTTTSNYIDYWTTEDVDGVPTLAEIEEDSKKYVEVSAGTVTGTIKLGDATNGYLYNSSSTNMLISTENSSNWSIIAWTDDTFTFEAGQYLSCRTDISNENRNKWRGAGSSCDCKTNESCSGVIYYNVYKYISGSTATYSAYTTTCDNTKATITYDLNGGTGATCDPQTVTKGEEFDLCDQTPTKEGYEFAGWTDGVNTYAAGATVTVDKSTTFYAKWNAKTITITWDQNYTDCPEAATSTYIYDGEEIAMPAEPIRTGYKFTGWFTAATDGTQVTEVGETNKPTADVTYYAHWAELYTVTFMASGQVYVVQEHKYLSGETLELPADPSAANYACDGYIFDGWSTYQQTKEDANRPELVDDNTSVENDLELHAVWKKASTSGAGTQIFYESFDTEEGSGANDGNWGNDVGTKTLVNDTWTFANGYGAYHCVKLGSSKNKGSATTPVLTQLSGDAKLSFKAAAWVNNNETTTLNLSISGGGTLTPTSVTMVKGAWTTYEVQIKDGTPSSTITFAAANASNNRFFLDEVMITTSGSYNYTTSPNCGPTMVAKENVWATSATGQSVKVNVPLGIKLFEGDATIIGTSTNENFVVNTLENTGNGEHNLVVTYTPNASNIKEDATITLTAKVGEETISTTTFTLNGRSLPDEFAIVVDKASEYFALPANMPSAGTYPGYSVTLNAGSVTSAPKTHLYTAQAVHSTRFDENGTALRLVGNNNACLWATNAVSGTDIRNYAQLDNAKTADYEWNLYTEDGDAYRISCSIVTEEGRILRMYGANFGMYKSGAEVFYLLPVECTSTPTNIQVSPARVSATISWENAATCDLQVLKEGTPVKTISGAVSPVVVTDLEELTAYTFTLTPTDAASCKVDGAFITTGPDIDIVEWMTDGMIIQVDKDEAVNPSVVINGEVEYNTGSGAVATELFFSKYFEAHGENKLLAIYNGTGAPINLSGYEIKSENGALDLSQFGQTTGQVAPNEEIILVYYDAVYSAEECAELQEGYENWNILTEKSVLAFSGRGSIGLYKDDVLIDVIGSTFPSGELTKIGISGKPDYCGTEDDVRLHIDEESVNDQSSFFCYNGDNIKTDEEENDYAISTNRCLLIRKNTVTSGANAVASNKAAAGATCGDLSSTFTTLCSEWSGFRIGGGKSSNEEIREATCDGLGYVGGFDYSKYYREYQQIGDPNTLDEFVYNEDENLYKITIDPLSNYSCLNVSVELRDPETDELLTQQVAQVPIIVASENTTTDELFSNIIADDLDASKTRCSTCDVVILKDATLTKAAVDTENDVNQVRDIYIYPGGKLVVPAEGNDYSVNSLSLRRVEDEVSMASVQTPLLITSSAANPIYVDVRVNSENWHWFTLPYNCNIADVTWADGTPAKYNVDWFLMWYDGESRAASTNPHDNHWKVYEGTTLEAGKGYIVGITGHPTKSKVKYELRFPMAQGVLTAEKDDKKVAVNAWGVQSDNTPNNLGWNLVGNPYMDYYNTASSYSLGGLPLIEYADTYDPITGLWDYEERESGSVPFLVIPQDGGWSEYKQELASGVDMQPFTAYFVQVGDPKNHENGEALNANFEANQRGRSPLIRRAPSEVDDLEEPAIVAISLTNAKGESDKTTLIIDDRFTNEYEMNGDFFKWFGDYYRRYTKPVLYSMGADQGKRAFNALSEQLAAQPVALGMFAAQAGDYTFTLTRKRCDLSRVEEVWLYDATTATYTNLMQQDYTFTTAKTEGEGRFYLSVKMRQNAPTDITDIYGGNIIATAKDGQIIVSGLTDNTQLWIYDATGKLLHTEHTTNFQHVYDVPVVGTYFVRTQGAGQAQTIKVLVE